MQGSNGWFGGVAYLLSAQLVISVALSVILHVFFDVVYAWHVVVGSLFVVLNALLMQRVFKRKDVTQRDIYVSAASRYVLFIVALLLCAWLGLNLLAILSGMVLAYVVSYIFSAYVFLSAAKKT